MHVLNKDIVHMIDHIFWKCNFRTELQGEQVFFFIIEIIVLFKIIAIIVLIEVVLKGTRWSCLPDHIWVDKRAAIAKKVDDLGDQFRLAMQTDGWLTSRRPILLSLDRENQSWEMMSDCLLVLGCFAHWIPIQMANPRFRIITIIVQIIAIIGNNWINWVRIDTVTAALMQSTSSTT
jgi:hypothetical protein